ncbi:MAG TPA: response regulator [Vicinamibacterales bacterium]|nr:response regulator [Vicinamibacterales bacterium]
MELRVLWGQQLFLTETFDEEARLIQRAEEIRASLRSRGWQLLPDQDGAPGEEGDGDDVEIGLPLEADPGPPRPDSGPFAPPDLGRRPTVLIVENAVTERQLLGSYLQQAGYSVCEAGDVEAGLNALNESAVDAVVLNTHLPDPMGWGRSGLEILRFIRLHAASAALPVLVVTPHRPEPEELDLIKGHRADLFVKPEGYPSLLQRLDQLTGRRESNRAGSIHP